MTGGEYGESISETTPVNLYTELWNRLAVSPAVHVDVNILKSRCGVKRLTKFLPVPSVSVMAMAMATARLCDRPILGIDQHAAFRLAPITHTFILLSAISELSCGVTHPPFDWPVILLCPPLPNIFKTPSLRIHKASPSLPPLLPSWSHNLP